MGFTVPSAVTVDAVSSYLAVSPLPDPLEVASKGPSAVYSLLHFPLPWSLNFRLATYSTQPLTGILPYGARTFLPILAYPAIAWPTFRGRLYACRAPASALRITGALLAGIRARKIRLLRRTKVVQIHRFASRKCLSSLPRSALEPAAC